MVILTFLIGIVMAVYCTTILLHTRKNPWFERDSSNESFCAGIVSDLVVGVLACIVPFVGKHYGVDDVTFLLLLGIRVNFLTLRLFPPHKSDTTRYFYDGIIRSSLACGLVGSVLPLYIDVLAMLQYGLLILGGAGIATVAIGTWAITHPRKGNRPGKQA